MNLNPSVVAKLALAFLAVGSDALRTAVNWVDVAAGVNAGDAASLKTAVQFFKDHKTEFFQHLDVTGSERFMSEILRVADLNAFIAGGSGRVTEATNVLKSIKDTDISAMQPEVCASMARFLDMLPKSAVNRIDATCAKTLLTTKKAIREAVFASIPSHWVGDKYELGTEVVAAIESKPVVMKKVPTDVTNKLVGVNKEKGNDFCAGFRASTVSQMTESQMNGVSSPCFVTLKGLETTDLSKTIPKLSTKVLAAVNDDTVFHQETIKKITPEQSAEIGSALASDELACGSLALNFMSKAAIAKIPAKCLQGYLKEGAARVGKEISVVPVDTFKALKDYEVIANINVADYSFLNGEVLNFVFNNVEVIAILPEADTIRMNPRALATVKLTADNFAKIAERNPTMAGQLLVYAAELPNDILSKVSGSQITSFKASIKIGTTEKELVGFELISSLRMRTNFEAIVLEASKDNSEHFCSKIESADDYLKMDWLRNKVTERCAEELKFDKNADFLASAPELAKNPTAWEVFVNDYREGDWKDAKKSLVSGLSSFKEFCKTLGEEEYKYILESLSTESLSVIEGTCVAEFKNAITEENASKFAPSAFALFKADDFKLKLKDLSIAQIPLVSSALPESDVASNVFAKIPVEELKTLDAAMVAAISSRQWSVIPAKNLSFLTAELFAAIKPENMTRFTDAQLDALEEKTLLAITVEQVKQVGTESKATLAALNKIASKLDVAKVEALNARKAAGSDAAGESSVMWYIIGGLVAIVIIGGVVFFFIRRK